MKLTPEQVVSSMLILAAKGNLNELSIDTKLRLQLHLQERRTLCRQMDDNDYTVDDLINQALEIAVGNIGVNIPEHITINQEKYDSLIKDSKLLAALQAGGVDNWEWYSESIQEHYPEYFDDEA